MASTRAFPEIFVQDTNSIFNRKGREMGVSELNEDEVSRILGYMRKIFVDQSGIVTSSDNTIAGLLDKIDQTLADFEIDYPKKGGCLSSEHPFKQALKLVRNKISQFVVISDIKDNEMLSVEGITRPTIAVLDEAKQAEPGAPELRQVEESEDRLFPDRFIVKLRAAMLDESKRAGQRGGLLNGNAVNYLLERLATLRVDKNGKITQVGQVKTQHNVRGVQEPEDVNLYRAFLTILDQIRNAYNSWSTHGIFSSTIPIVAMLDSAKKSIKEYAEVAAFSVVNELSWETFNTKCDIAGNRFAMACESLGLFCTIVTCTWCGCMPCSCDGIKASSQEIDRLKETPQMRQQM